MRLPRHLCTNQKFLDHLTFLEPIGNDMWHDFTLEVQTVAHRYRRKRSATAGATGVASSSDSFAQQSYQVPQQQIYGFQTSPPAFLTLPNIGFGYMPSPGFPPVKSPRHQKTCDKIPQSPRHQNQKSRSGFFSLGTSQVIMSAIQSWRQ